MTKILTKEGFEKLRNELENRRTALRQEIATAIKEAKEQGDLSENAEYSTARQRQSENESRIAELEDILKNAEIAEKSKHCTSVQVGSIITVKTQSGEMKFHIVGSNEIDPAHGKISNESPIGRVFIGKKKGDIAKAQTPSGEMKFEILEIQ
jgi:transcription elongation factor GreA